MNEMAAIHRVLSISELLKPIFDYSTSKDNLINALVCRRWSDEALNARWRVVMNPCNLLRLLAPLESMGIYAGSDTHIFIFTRQITPDDWRCFDKYAWRVHELYFFGSYFDESVFDDIASSRPRDTLLPNLRELGPSLDVHVLPLFASPSLRAVYPGRAVEDGTDDDDTFLTLTFPCLPSVAPRLEVLHFTIDVPFRTDDDRASLDATIRQLTTLKVLHVPGNWLTPSLTDALATLPNLLTIDTRYSSCASNKDGDEELFSLSLPIGSFPVLKHLYVDVQYRRFAISFPQAHSSNTLSSLSLVSPTSESSSDLARLLYVVIRCCPGLEKLQLKNIPKGHHPVPFEPITLSLLSPILSGPNLQIIDLCHPNPFTLYVEDFISIVKALPYLTELRLRQRVDNRLYDLPTLHLSVLSALAALSTNLEVLQIALDTSVDDRLLVNDISSFTRTKLRQLEVGYSPLLDPIPVAVYLSRVLPDGCFIGYHHHCHSDLPEAVFAERWKQVKQFLSAVQGVRDEERRWQPALSNNETSR